MIRTLLLNFRHDGGRSAVYARWFYFIETGGVAEKKSRSAQKFERNQAASRIHAGGVTLWLR